MCSGCNESESSLKMGLVRRGVLLVLCVLGGGGGLSSVFISIYSELILGFVCFCFLIFCYSLHSSDLRVGDWSMERVWSLVWPWRADTRSRL